MNHKQEYIKEQTEISRGWFKDHKASYILNYPGVSLIEWKNPNSWNYACRFIIHRQWLCVVGDIGEATFQWSEDITHQFLSGIDFGYFMSKCRASEHGRKFESWDVEVAGKMLKQRIAEINEIPEWIRAWEDGEELEILEEIDEDCTRESFTKAGQEFYDSTGDAEGAGKIAQMGTVPSVHAIGMFVGLQMAIEQIKNDRSGTPPTSDACNP